MRFGHLLRANSQDISQLSLYFHNTGCASDIFYEQTRKISLSFHYIFIIQDALRTSLRANSQDISQLSLYLFFYKTDPE